MAICSRCKHMRWGRPLWTVPSLYASWMICAAKPTEGGGTDPQTGRPTPVIGTPCERVNPDGKCGDFVRAGLLTRLLRL